MKLAMQKKAKTDLYAAKAKRKKKLSDRSGYRSYFASQSMSFHVFRKHRQICVMRM